MYRASWLASLAFLGAEVPPPPVRRGEKMPPPGSVPFSMEKRNAPGLAATFDGKARTIRRKMTAEYPPDEAHWLSVMMSAFDAARHGKTQLARHVVASLLRPIGEIRFGETILFAMIAEREKIASPDFMTNPQQG
jgi:hypothetical protein